MNKMELIEALSDSDALLSKSTAADIVKLFFDEMTNALANGDRVEIRGFCSFFVKEYKGYIGRNPKTVEQVNIAPKKLPFFKPGKELKERVDR
ncbi:integration host factor subunit beta [Desulfosarcina widdelii]|uniref:Integration host factor subunit beta n=1 Tax=Desulfosarcina widdelii TaxID=947919 RepID=A0A5K7Z7T1_9BACT|nr:HU family DNA-binding protein [Desulfosarcina widdelii]BBO76219.1 integration host factor subunit beta [Desulfosarcina widdelii]